MLCKLGLHKWILKDVWLPSFSAEIVTDVITDVTCKWCGKVKSHTHLVWNQETGEMENAINEKR